MYNNLKNIYKKDYYRNYYIRTKRILLHVYFFVSEVNLWKGQEKHKGECKNRRGIVEYNKMKRSKKPEVSK